MLSEKCELSQKYYRFTTLELHTRCLLGIGYFPSKGWQNSIDPSYHRLEAGLRIFEYDSRCRLQALGQ